MMSVWHSLVGGTMWVNNRYYIKLYNFRSQPACVLSNMDGCWWLCLCVCVCECLCIWGLGVCTWVCVPSSCMGPQGQPCVDWVSSTHSSLAESERNPHRWLSTFKKVGCLRHVNWGLSSFCSFLWHCTIQAIFVYSIQKVQKHGSLVTSENVFSNERSDYWTGACTCHSSPQITCSKLTCFQCYRWRACLFCKHQEMSSFRLEVWYWTVWPWKIN